MTSSLAGGLRGSRRRYQPPRVCHRPPYSNEDAGDEAIELAESVGLVLQPWQQQVVRVALAERDDGKWAATSVGYLVARQNGKSWALDAIVLHGMFIVGDPLTVWTSHEMKTSAESFRRMRGWIDGSDDLRRMVAPNGIKTANGQEGIELVNGVRLRFFARSKSSGRGPSPQRIIFDEAQELSDQALEALIPSMSAQPNRQAIYTGTVPGPDTTAPEVFTRLRDRGRAGAPGRHAWMEWTPDGSDSPRTAAAIDLDSRRVWSQSNPARAAGVLDDEAIIADRQDMSDEGFARERASIWPTVAAGSGVIDMAAWAAREAPPVETSAPTVLAIETTPDRSSTVFVLIGMGADETPRVGVQTIEPGTEWVPARVAEVAEAFGCDAVVMDGKGAASSLIPDVTAALEPLGLELTTTTAADVGAACGQMFDAIRDGTLTHDGNAQLTAAVAGAKTRPLGDGLWAWDRKTGPAIAPLVAATLGLWKWRDLASSGDALSNIW